MNTIQRTVAATAALMFAGTGVAVAHHGWAWTEDGDFVLAGEIEEIYLGNPHARLTVVAEDEVWTVDLAPPSRTEAAGFVEGVAAVGDEVIAIGNRSRDESELRMKAKRVVVNGETYDVYPNDFPADYGQDMAL